MAAGKGIGGLAGAPGIGSDLLPMKRQGGDSSTAAGKAADMQPLTQNGKDKKAGDQLGS